MSNRTQKLIPWPIIIWGSYLCLAAPILGIGILTGLGFIEFLISTPSDTAAPTFSTSLEGLLVTVPMLTYPILWLLSLTCAHKFNGGWKPLIPYSINLTAITYFLILSYVHPAATDPSDPGISIYLVTLTIILLSGITLIISNKKSRPLSEA